MKKLLSVLQLFPFCFASTHPYAWTQVCETEPSWEGRGSLSVRGDIVRQFTDETGILNIIMDNQERNIEVKCKSSLGDPRISQDGMDITSNWPGTSSSERPEGQSRPSVNLTLWKQNFTTFWKVDKLIKCNAGTERECSARVIEVKDGNWVKGNCTVLGQGTAGKPEIMNCNIRDWVENAMRAKGNSACFNKGDFNGAAEYQYSFRNHKANNWTKCREFNEETGGIEHKEEQVTHIKCDVTDHDNTYFLVKMEKIHHSKQSVAMPIFHSPPCNEAAYFWVEGEKKETHISIPREQFWGAAIGVPVVVGLLILMSIVLFCRKHKYKHKYLKSTSQTEADTEQGSPLSEYQQANSGFDPNYREQEGGPHKKSKLSMVSLQRSVSDYPIQNPEEQMNPSLPITAMPHLLEMDPRMELPRERLKLGYYLGQGQFGLVYEGSATGLFGEHEDKVVKVAVKEIKDTKAEGWADELKILSSLDMHLNLVNLLGACTWPPDLPTYILLEYCSFGDLKKFLCKHKDEFESRLKGVPGNYESPYTATLLLRWCYDIAEGMAYLSKEKVMHGDLAARNIMVGENFTAKISDFGLSKIIPYYNEGAFYPFKFIPALLESLTSFIVRLQENPEEVDSVGLDGHGIPQDWRLQHQVRCVELWGCALGDSYCWQQTLRHK